jgi:hypothetical protein
MYETLSYSSVLAREENEQSPADALMLRCSFGGPSTSDAPDLAQERQL